MDPYTRTEPYFDKDLSAFVAGVNQVVLMLTRCTYMNKAVNVVFTVTPFSPDK